MRKLIISILIGVIFPLYASAGFVFRNDKDVTVVINDSEEQVVHTAFEMFQKDYVKVFDRELKTSNQQGNIYIGTIGLNKKAEQFIAIKDIQELKQHEEAFLVSVKDNHLIILGSDKRGTAYGILELSRMIGVSPWEWWADSPVEKKQSFKLKEGFKTLQYPSVARRGIFINDEDWGLTPWSYLTHEPSDTKGQIGPKTHARIFELLLRLRANTFWPAMHTCSVAFYLTPGNKETADKYGIFIGTAHCEPMMRNTNAEWKTAGTGKYDYVNNRENVLKFWEERVKELAGSDNIYTLGIRGVHDGKMQGANTLQEQKAALTNVLKDQREMIAKYVNPNVEQVSQVFIPYKEVLNVYKMGLEVPEDVSLLWCDDNYGYIRHFPDSKERARKGGNGIYYHISYWGRPHSYLWLATNHPAQLYTQMKLAYDKGAQDMWILNVGDIKPGEYLTELFLDMAWDINAIENNTNGLDKHLYSWLSREFGEKNAKELLPVMNEYYRLAYIRKPEFMGNTRIEEKDPKYKIISDLPWSEKYIKQRIKEYETIAAKVTSMSQKVAPDKQFVWFQLIEFPVRAAHEMNKKHLYGQLARHELADWRLSDTAYNNMASLMERYNSLNNGKWKKMMSYPQSLPVFKKVPHTRSTTPLPEDDHPLYLFNGKDYSQFNGESPVTHGLGYQRGAISLSKGSDVIYNFKTNDTDSILIEVALTPNHPVEGKQIRYAISIGNEPEQIVDFHTEGRSEEWKLNVLSNQAKRTTSHKISSSKKQSLKITALDEGVMIDQIKIRKK
ncbi:glycosyl hydrolase 115 family protein [Bacteroides faecis]|jgi:hypothetical protein|uniref:glycosyl hydrolase 115 family protein n=1 Tax=Bacteroides faecis TaxID=674529 RepID=UPI002201B0E3|nr:glycosyl hydrolase 115 family protein [Bacteroides faecis]MCS3122695.1 glycosyl hydrolase 115 family protein [Bacteroides faecis]UVQ60618.1 glycosyl hydrolase 115 family protein [Bacteroides faecis]